MVKLTVSLAAALACSASAVSPANPPLQGMTVWGYQGWYTGNWKWFVPAEVIAGPPTGKQRVLTDYIPYVDEYPQNCWEPTNFILANGSTANWFYSNCSAVVEKHFQWMVKYKIDGVFVQRFGSATFPTDTYYNATLQVLQWVRQFAEKYNKYFAVEYDYGGLKNTTDPSLYIDNFRADYVNKIIPLFSSPSYIYQNGKPVVQIYGAGFSQDGGTGPAFQQLYDIMSNSTSPPWKILGIPWYWQNYKPPGNDPNGMWSLYKNMDCLSPWGVGAYNDPSGFANYYKFQLKTGKNTTDSLGIKFAPVIHPGTENVNAAFNVSAGMPKGQFGIGRYNSTLLQYGLGNASSSDLKPHFIFGAMFDEYTEGSQILPALKWNELPANTNPGFAGTDNGLDRFTYMNISGNWTAAFHRTWGQAPLSP